MIVRFAAWLKRLVCVHDYIIMRDGDTLRLECMKCQRLTAGWLIPVARNAKKAA